MLYLLAVLLLPLQLPAALVLPNRPKQVACDWDGMDDTDGDGSTSFSSLGQTITATLSLLCNQKKGYKVILSSPNATAATVSYLKSGANQIRYTATMDTSGIQNATIRRQRLDLTGSSVSLRVKFRGSGNILPKDGATQANVATFYLTLDGFTGALNPVGTYTDIITATCSIP